MMPSISRNHEGPIRASPLKHDGLRVSRGFRNFASPPVSWTASRIISLLQSFSPKWCLVSLGIMRVKIGPTSLKTMLWGIPGGVLNCPLMTAVCQSLGQLHEWSWLHFQFWSTCANLPNGSPSETDKKNSKFASGCLQLRAASSSLKPLGAMIHSGVMFVGVFREEGRGEWLRETRVSRTSNRVVFIF